MYVSPTAARFIAKATWVAAWVSLALAPIHALARFATADGSKDLESGVVRAWAVPAADRFHSLLSWSSPDTVYLTYGKLWVPIVALALASAYVVRGSRGDVTRSERVAWRTSFVAMWMMTLGAIGSYFGSLFDPRLVDGAAGVLSFPAVLLSFVAFTWLGIVLLRRRFRPLTTGLLLTAWVPSVLVLSSLIALGAALIPFVWAFALAARAAVAKAEGDVSSSLAPATVR